MKLKALYYNVRTPTRRKCILYTSFYIYSKICFLLNPACPIIFFLSQSDSNMYSKITLYVRNPILICLQIPHTSGKLRELPVNE